MKEDFKHIQKVQYQMFHQFFDGDTTDTLCSGCDGLCETSTGFSTTVFLLPGELEFLIWQGINPENLLDPILTPAGLIYCWSPARTCSYLVDNRCVLGKDYGVKPVECGIYPLIFQKQANSQFEICSVCRHRSLFINSGFTENAIRAVSEYLMPFLDSEWLKMRNELNFTINEEKYHQLKNNRQNRVITLAELKTCRL